MPDRSDVLPLRQAAELSPVKRALLEIRSLRARLQDLESRELVAAEREPIAIIGAGLRFPGGVIDGPSFWQLLAEGKDAITEIPRERWDWRAYFDADADAPGSMYTQHGGFLDAVDLFDAPFFGISPREAVAMDPQHRLALELAWEALENSGHSPDSLHGSVTGVFLGIANNDYGRTALADLDGIDAYTGSGNSPAMVAGRLSYVLGLHGPSLAVDTSCSSSLVAVHLACASLRAEESSLALAGGVNLILSPESNIALSKAHMMARDGRCKTFDEAADGYVRSEGGCILVLKNLSSAISEGDRILAVIRGSAVNHDGRSGGLTAPNGPAQAAVIRAALEAAGVNPGDIGYVETHGTGTALGDPIEVETLASVMSAGRSADYPLAIGAVKTNIGHAEAASGIAGLMKTVLALEHHQIPASLHLHRKNPHIDWDRLPVVVPTEMSAWKPLNGHRYAGVSSFGFSGTNAHIIVEEAPARAIPPDSFAPRRHLLTLSARTPMALDTLCEKYVAALRACAPDGLADLCFTANAGRALFEHRVAVIAETAEEMAVELERAHEKTSSSRIFFGAPDSSPAGSEERRVGFLFTGQGSQYAGMGGELYENAAVFRAAMERCAAAWKQGAGESLIELLYPAEGAAGNLEQARHAQPALFAFEYALAELWRSWGVEPSVLLGHSLGEYVAAVVAGVFSMEDGLKLVCARARLMDTLTIPGTMRAISASAERVEQAIAGDEKEVGIAVINGPESVVISGAAEAVARVAGKLEAEGIRTRALEVTHAFHSPLLDPILDEFEHVASEITFHAPRIRMISNRTGKAARAEEIATPRYWREHMRGTVQFYAGLEAALATGCQTWIEIGPQPHLKALAIRADASLETRMKISARRQRSAWQQMLETLATLYVEGQRIDWAGFYESQRRVRIALPTYPFERQRYWLAASGTSSSQVWLRSTSAALAQSTLAPIGLNVVSFPAKWKALERLTVAEILKTFRELGAFAQPGTAHDADSLTASCKILPAHKKLMARWLNLLCDAGYLEQFGSHFVNRTPLPEPDTNRAWKEVESLLGDDPFVLEYLRSCSKHLAAVLLGTISPLETLFPGGSAELAGNLYENSGGARYANLIAAAAVQAACSVRASNRRLRILEVGGGTGATTAAILPGLPNQRVSYLFSDVSEVFLERASARFARYPFVRYGLFDIEDAALLARHAGSFDLVIAANVVHATRNVEATLAGIAGLLVPGGTVVLLETTKDLAWHNITTGLIEGWQKSDDELRGTRTLLGVEEWSTALRAAGFQEVTAVPEAGSTAEEIGLHVILARASTVAGGTATPAPLIRERALLPAATSASTQPTVVDIHAVLRAAPLSERRAILLDAISQEIASVLRLPTGEVPKKRDRLMELGMDSLMAVELRNRLAVRLGLDSLPSTLIFDYPTPEAITGYLLDRIQLDPAQREDMERAPRQVLYEPTLTAEQVADLPEEDVATLLRSRLRR